jgi:AcrR family transcriptional regulator
MRIPWTLNPTGPHFVFSCAQPSSTSTGTMKPNNAISTLKEVCGMQSLPFARKSANNENRRAAILDAAVVLFGQRGFYGTSLQTIASTVGMTKAGVLHHVGSKEGLLGIVLDEVYDNHNDEMHERYLAKERPLMAQMWRDVVAMNAKRPEQVHMFSTLDAESIDPDHPAHQYFLERDRDTIDLMLDVPWDVPDGVNVEQLLNAGFSMMDGIQLRWLRNPESDLNQLWAQCEDQLMPLPMWEGYR